MCQCRLPVVETPRATRTTLARSDAECFAARRGRRGGKRKGPGGSKDFRGGGGGGGVGGGGGH
jgi:hypothetical protein